MPIALSPDGKTLAAAYHLKGQSQSLLHFWDLPTRRIRATLRGHTSLVEWAAFSRDGRSFASGSWDRTVRLWDGATGDPIGVMTGHMDVVYSGCFSPDGLTLASASWDGTVRLWQVSTGQELMVLQGRNRGEIWSVAFAPDGKALAAGRSSRYAGSEVLLWQGATARQIGPAGGGLGSGRRTGGGGSLSGHTGAVNGLAYAADGSFLASGSDDASVILWDPDPGTGTAAR